MTRRTLLSTLAVGLCFVLLPTGSALAAWVLAGSGSGVGKALSLNVPTGGSAASPTTSSLSLSWTAPSGGAPATAYQVLRNGTPVASGGCADPVSATSCVDSGLASGTTYTYTVKARVGANWLGNASTSFPGTTTAATTPIAFGLSTTTTTPTAGSSFSMTITARVTGGSTDTTYTGTHSITFSGPGTSNLNFAPTYNGSTSPVNVSFTNGAATIPVVLYRAETTTIAVSDGVAARNATSASITVSALASATKLVFTGATTACPSGAITITKNTTWSSSVSIADTYGNVKANPGGIITVNSSMNATSDHALASGATLTINAGANPGTTSAALAVNLNSGNNKVGTITSSATGYTSVGCTITGT